MDKENNKQERGSARNSFLYEESFLSNFHSDVLSAVSLGISTVCIIIVAKLSLVYRKTQVLLGSYLLLQNLDNVKGYPIDLEGDEYPIDLEGDKYPIDLEGDGDTDKFICHDPQVSILLSVLSVLGTVFLLAHQCRNGRFCKGYMYSNTFVLKLVCQVIFTMYP